MHGMLEQQESSIQKAAPGNCLGSLQTLTVLIKKPGHQQESFLLFDAEPALATAPLRFSPPPSGLAHTADLSSRGHTALGALSSPLPSLKCPTGDSLGSVPASQ